MCAGLHVDGGARAKDTGKGLSGVHAWNNDQATGWLAGWLAGAHIITHISNGPARRMHG